MTDVSDVNSALGEVQNWIDQAERSIEQDDLDNVLAALEEAAAYAKIAAEAAQAVLDERDEEDEALEGDDA